MANFKISQLVQVPSPAGTAKIEVETAEGLSGFSTLNDLLATASTAAVVSELTGDVDALITLSGVAENATDLGAFTGTTIPNANTVKAALQALETAVESVVVGAVDSDDVANVSTVAGAVVSDALESLQTSIAGFTAISGSTAVGSWVQPTNTTFSAFQSAVAAAQASATITGVYLKAGNYDWSANTNFALTGNAVHVWAEPLAIISMPGANQTLGADLFLIRTNFFWTGGRFINGGNVFSIRDLATRVERIEIDGVTGSQLGSIFYHDLTTKNASADLGHVRISRCTVDNVNSFVHVRSGTNAINSSIVPDYFDCWGNTAKVIDKYCCVWVRDDPPTNGAWEKVSVCNIHHNHFEDFAGRSASTVTGWMINFGAFQFGYCEDNILLDCRNGNRIDCEVIYFKSKYARVQRNIIWYRLTTGTQTQGMIAAKGESQGAVPADILIKDNLLIVDHPGRVNAALWMQASNIRFINNTVFGPYVGAAISTQSSFQHRGCELSGNKFGCPNVPGNFAYISISGHFPRLKITNNTLEMFAPSGTVAAIQVRSGSGGSTLNVDDVVISGNCIYNLNTAATVRAIELYKNAGGLLDPLITDNVAIECQQFLRIQTGVVQGRVFLKGNHARNRTTTLTAVSDAAGGSNILQLRNSWQAGES